MDIGAEIISDPDSISWFYNLIANTPLFFTLTGQMFEEAKNKIRFLFVDCRTWDIPRKELWL